MVFINMDPDYKGVNVFCLLFCHLSQQILPRLFGHQNKINSMLSLVTFNELLESAYTVNFRRHNSNFV